MRALSSVRYVPLATAVACAESRRLRAIETSRRSSIASAAIALPVCGVIETTPVVWAISTGTPLASTLPESAATERAGLPATTISPAKQRGAGEPEHAAREPALWQPAYHPTGSGLGAVRAASFARIRSGRTAQTIVSAASSATLAANSVCNGAIRSAPRSPIATA